MSRSIRASPSPSGRTPAVCSGVAGHTEAVRVRYDPSRVSYERLCDLLLDRLGENRYALNRVGNDQGTQYRHGIYFADDAQKKTAEAVVKKLAPDGSIINGLAFLGILAFFSAALVSLAAAFSFLAEARSP